MSLELTKVGVLLPAASLCWREIVRFYRQPSRVAGALGTPVIFWLLIGSGIGTSFQDPGNPSAAGYLEYFFPGTLLLIVLFTSVFCMMSMIEDRREGFLQSVLVAPTPRASLVLGKVLGGTFLGVAQGLIFVLMSPAAGIPLRLGQVLLVIFILFLIALAVAGLGFAAAWAVDSVQGFHGVVNLVLLPLWVLSGAMFPSAGASPWVRVLMKANPLSYAMAGLRRALASSAPDPGLDLASIGVSIGVVSLFALLTLAAALALGSRTTSRSLV